MTDKEKLVLAIEALDNIYFHLKNGPIQQVGTMKVILVPQSKEYLAKQTWIYDMKCKCNKVKP